MSLLAQARARFKASPAAFPLADGPDTKPAPPALARPVSPYVAFPTHTLPGPLRAFVRGVALAIGCDEAFAGIPALVACAAAIGNTRRVGPKDGWTEPAVIWAALVGESGVRKSPAFRAAMRPLVEAEQRFRDEYRVSVRRYRELEDSAENAPTCRRVLTEDITIESIALILVDNDRGVVNGRDEIEDWFQAMTRYKGKNGGTDRARWLKLSNADTLIVDRKTGDPSHRSLFVPMAICSIVGTIQPGVLRASLDHLARESGLAARLLLAKPDYRPGEWTEAEVDPDAKAAYADAVRSLLAVNMDRDARCKPRPVTVALGPEAKDEWVPWYNAVQERKRDAEPGMRAVWAKLEGYALRFALVYHVTECVAAGGEGREDVSVDAMRSGMQLAEWFAHEAERIYATLDEGDDDRACRELADWVRSRGGRCTVRDLQRARRRSYPTSKEAQAALDQLAESGFGRWEDETVGGRTQRVFTIVQVSALAEDTDSVAPTPEL